MPTVAHEENIWSCAYGQSDKDGSEYILTGSLDNNVKVWKWNVDRLEYIRTCEGHRLGVLSVDINKSGTLAASSSLDAQIIIWDLESGQQMRSFDGAANLDAWTLMFSPDSRFIATGCQEGDINLIGVDSGKIERTISLKGKFCLSIAYSPLGTHLAAGALNGMINICDIQTGQLKSQDGHAMPVRGLAFSHDGQRLVSASDDGQIKVYDVTSGSVVTTLTGHSNWVLGVDFCADNRHIVSCSSDKTVRIWDLNNNARIQTLYDHDDVIFGVRYNPQGNRLVSVSDDRSMCVYDCSN
uniref:WD repeat containing protein-61 n=1 Tax=Schmidtea mediterranea TaxID=79327 RepID=I1ZIF7_SCHMD|nr:WD repeat containing protein-61 [Schmidtea mediterranea]